MQLHVQIIHGITNHAAGQFNSSCSQGVRSHVGDATLVVLITRHQDVAIHSPSCSPAIIL